MSIKSTTVSSTNLLKDPKKYREVFSKELKKQMAEVFTNKRNLKQFAKKAGVEIPPYRMDKPSLLLYIAEALTVQEMNKHFSLGGTDSTFIDQVEMMDRKDRMCTQKQYTAQGTITKIQVDSKDFKNKRKHYRPTKAQLADHEKRFDKKEKKVNTNSSTKSNSMRRIYSSTQPADVGHDKIETEKKEIEMLPTIDEEDAPDKLNSSDFIQPRKKDEQANPSQ